MRHKISRKINANIVAIFRKMYFYPMIYASWWHALFHKPNLSDRPNSYLSAIPNPDAGIGHQMANWIAGLWFSREFNLPHAYIAFASTQWDCLLGFGERVITVDDLVHRQGYRKVLLPLFDEFNPDEVGLTKRIISSYGNKKVIFLLEQDQFYRDQFGVMNEIQSRFFSASARHLDQTRYSSEYFNIAMHVRRGDIVAGQLTGNPNLLMRWQDSKYFENVLAYVLGNTKQVKPIKIFIFSQGDKQDFQSFEKFGDIQLCLEMGARDSFLHMVKADLLISSKSSFSYKPALLSRGIKVCPRDFWHGYPDKPDWILADEDGGFDNESIRKLRAI